MSLEQIRQQAYNELDKLGFTKLFDNRPKDAIPPVWEDLWFLYQKVRERKPLNVFEYGSGCSSFIISQAIIDNGNRAMLYSMESEHDWLIKTIESTPFHLQKWIDLWYVSIGETEYEHTRIYSYTANPARQPNMIYLDGPELTENIKITIDPLVLEVNFANDFYMVVDGRWETVDFLEKHLKGKYDIQRNYEENRTTFERIG